METKTSRSFGGKLSFNFRSLEFNNNGFQMYGFRIRYWRKRMNTLTHNVSFYRWFYTSTILKAFYHTWARRPSWSCDHNYSCKLSFSRPMRAPREIWLPPAFGFGEEGKNCKSKWPWVQVMQWPWPLISVSLFLPYPSLTRKHHRDSRFYFDGPQRLLKYKLPQIWVALDSGQ